MKKLIFIAFLAVTIFAIACKKSTDSPQYQQSPVAFYTPPHFPIVNLPADNPQTLEGIALGRKLYYDSLLHPDQNLSCATCHQQEFGFSMPAAVNPMVHVNLAWSKYFLWNGAIEGSLEDAMRFEVDVFFKTDISKLQADAEYPELYNKAFNSSQVTSENTAKALAQFLRTATSFNSDYDKYFRGEKQLSASAYRGYVIFNSEKGDCFHCHALPLLADNQFHDTGLDSIYNPDNLGRYSVTYINSDKGKFKTPSLRNVALTAPYMHDGRFNTLVEVIEFYNSGTQHSPNLDPIMTKAGKEFGLQLSEADKMDLYSFLLTFTDDEFLGNTDLSQPK